METNNTSTTFNASKISTTTLPYPYAAVLSVVGNILVAIVLIVRKRLTKKVCYLAATDFFMAVICIPYTCYTQVYGQWLLPSALCTIVLFVQDALQAVSVLTITAIGIDRYFAILFPLKFRWLRSDWAIITGLVTIWLVAIADSMTDLFYVQKQTFYISGVEIYECDYVYHTIKTEKRYMVSSFLITYPILIAILVFCYTSIAWKLYYRTSPGNADAERDLHQRQNTIKVIKMLVVIVVVFVLCWTPLQMFGTMMTLTFVSLHMTAQIQRILIAGFIWFSLCNCFANPVIYCFSNEDFWKDLKFIIEKNDRKT